jgi:aminoglycoside phosphotransferase family enzyme/predicted kinase
VYLGVVPLLRIGNDYHIREVVNMRDATLVDYLVRMRRLPPERTLAALLAAGQVTKVSIHALAKRLVHFHNTAATKDAAIYGAPEIVWQAVADNFHDTAPFVGQTISEKQYSRIQDFSHSFFREQRILLQQRIAQGRVREGHGDLRCDHVYFLDQGISIIDCIEFSPRLRTCDVASELAFLAMDLELQGAPDLAAELLHTYAVQADDPDLFRLLPFYQCYRAYVRGKVESLKSQEQEISAEERERARRQAQRTFRLAARYARGTPPPALIVVCGRVGTGKSTVAKRLSEHTGFVSLNSDVIRKRLAGVLPTAHVGAEYLGGIYSEEFSQRTYATLFAQVEEELDAGRGVIVDATCKRREDRQLLLELAQRQQRSILFLECRASLTEVKRRLREREQRGDSASDATWQLALREQESFPAFNDIPERCHIIVDTEQDLAQALEAVEERLAHS